MDLHAKYNLRLNPGCKQVTGYEVGPCPNFYLHHVLAMGPLCLVKEAGPLPDRGPSSSLGPSF